MSSFYLINDPNMYTCLIGMFLEGFLYGLYSGIFTLYLKFQSKKSRKASIIFYALCLLYVLSTATVVIDFVIIMLQLIKYFPPIGIIYYDSPSTNVGEIQTIFILGILQTLASGLCDFIAQCILLYSPKSSKIYRCWIVWDQNIRVVIIPSFLAIAYIAIWLSSECQLAFVYDFNGSPRDILWAIDKWFEGSMGSVTDMSMATLTVGHKILMIMPLDPVIIASFALSIAVNTLATGLIVFKILKVFLEVKPTSDERALGATGGTKLRHIIFIIIESGMALFAIQLVRVVLSCLPLQESTLQVFNLMTGINQMLNGIAPTIILVRVTMRLSIEENESFKEAVESLRFNNPLSDPDHTLQQVPVGDSSMPPQESPEETQWSEDICFNNPPSNPNTFRRMESSSSMPSQERSGLENTTV